MGRIGIFGGTFNPVHKGHEVTAVNFYDKFELDRLLIIPANIPPHKKNDESVSPRDRFEMCRLCFNKYSDKNIEVSDIEIKKDCVNYSIDTIKTICGNYPSDTIYFLVGSDMFLYIEKWRDYKELLGMCTFVAAYRDKKSTAKLCALRNKLSGQGYKTELLENEILQISSTELRKKIQEGGFDLENYLCPEILNYIKEKKFYVL